MTTGFSFWRQTTPLKEEEIDYASCTKYLVFFILFQALVYSISCFLLKQIDLIVFIFFWNLQNCLRIFYVPNIFLDTVLSLAQTLTFNLAMWKFKANIWNICIILLGWFAASVKRQEWGSAPPNLRPWFWAGKGWITHSGKGLSYF